MRQLIVLILFLCPTATHAVVSEDALPSQAEWISATAPAPGAEPKAETAFFRRPFELGANLVKAVLLVAADRQAEVFINGERAAEMTGFAQAATMDVTKFVRAGTNVIALRASNNTGQAAFRLMLELATSDGKQRWLVSDRSWLASRTEAADWTQAGFAAKGWTPAFTHGEAGLKKWGNPFNATKSVDAYNSWMLARGADRATDPATMTTLPGFRVELLRSAQPDEDSWVALAFDPKGRVTVAREKRGLLRMTLGQGAVERVEVIEDTLLECRGLLYAHGSLFVNANNSKGFYRLRDTNGDDQFDEKKLLLQTQGGVGHGRNHLTLGPDGLIYLSHGDDVVLPDSLAPDSPLQQMATDQLMPNRDPKRPQRVQRYMQVGHVLQTDKDGSFFRIVAGGLRNPLDVAFNEHGEMFTYDADMERDIAAPWYRPTRVLHLVPGGDYGWRRSPPNIPPYAPDMLPGAVDIGVGSPTGVAFGTKSLFPEKYQRAFFIADWAYGRILAVHLRPEGASYRGSSETFLSGRPLNVTDLVIGPDGGMYFTTGGRGTKSGLYRVTFNGPQTEALAKAGEPPAAAELRALRRRLESTQSAANVQPPLSPASVIEELWPHLNHPDLWVRTAARVALERQPLQLWIERALTERNPSTSLSALLALGRIAGDQVQSALLTRLSELPLASLSETEQLAVLRLCALRLARVGWPGDDMASRLARHFDAIYPSSSRAVNHELCRLLSFLRAPGFVSKTAQLLSRTRSTEDLVHYTFYLCVVRDGWTPDHQRVFFDALRRAEQEQGGRDYYGMIKSIRKQLADSLTPEERTHFADVLAPASASPITLGSMAATLPFVQEWKLEDLDLAATRPSPSLAAGREAFVNASCAQCHRFSNEGQVFGPDLTSVAARFNRRDLLDAILNPSKAIDDKFRTSIVKLKDGEVITGVVEREDGDMLVLSTGVNGDSSMEIAKTEIDSRHLSEISPMPTGLLNVLKKEQILDLLAYLESGAARAEAPK